MESGIGFVCCDMPCASNLTIYILAAVAEEETRLISERTKSALTAYKARGGVLGPATFRNRHEWKAKQEQSRQRATRRNSELAIAAYDEIRPIVQNLRGQGLSFQRIAEALNKQGFRTRLTGSEWSKTQVKRLVDRLR